MTSIYKGTVKYPMKDEPWEGQFGPSYSLGIEMADPTAPKTNEEGVTNVYKSPDAPDIEYLRGLEYGDEVTMIWVKKADSKYGGYWSIDVPEGAPAKKPVAKVAKTMPRLDDSVWEPMSVEDALLWRAVCDDLAIKLQVAYSIMEDWLGETASVEDKLKCAITLFIRANSVVRPGMRLPGELPEPEEVVVENKPLDEMFMDSIDANNPARSIIDSISKLLEFYKSPEQVASLFKSIGITSDSLAGEDDYANAWNAAVFFASAIGSGKDEAVAVAETKEKFEPVPF